MDADRLPDPHGHVEAIRAHLAAEIAIGGQPVPVDVGRGDVPGIAVWPVVGEDRDGSAANPESDVGYPYQLHCHAATWAQALWLEGQCDRALIGRRLPVPGRSVLWVSRDGGGGIVPDRDTGEPEVFTARPVYRVQTTPTKGA